MRFAGALIRSSRIHMWHIMNAAAANVFIMWTHETHNECGCHECVHIHRHELFIMWTHVTHNECGVTHNECGSHTLCVMSHWFVAAAFIMCLTHYVSCLTETHNECGCHEWKPQCVRHIMNAVSRMKAPMCATLMNAAATNESPNVCDT